MANNNLFEEAKASYQRVIDVILKAGEWSSKGSIANTSFAVKKVIESLRDFGHYLNELNRNFLLFRFIDECSSPYAYDEQLSKFLSYARNPDTFLAEAYLVSAEKALQKNEMSGVASAYKQIKKGENLRILLDAQDSPEHNLKERVEKLDKLVSIIQNQNSCLP
ncbi:MAG: hypothetical protein QW666_01160 [Candidatus Woesearchaeota archaeon]